MSRQIYKVVRIEQIIENITISIGESDLNINTMNHMGEHFTPREQWINSNKDR